MNTVTADSCESAVEDEVQYTFSTFHANSLSPSVLPWDRFSQWIYCICVVTFDLELGQAMEVL